MENGAGADGDSEVFATVKRIGSVVRRGVLGPVTPSGTFLVHGAVLVSNLMNPTVCWVVPYGAVTVH